MALTNRLRKVRLKELSLVDKPANQKSFAILHKRAERPMLFSRVDALLTKALAQETTP